MPDNRIFKAAIIGIVLLFSAIAICYAFEDDGFGPARKIESRHFTIYYSPQLEAGALSEQLNIRPSDEVLVGSSREAKFSSEAGLADMVDTLFIQVCNALDMQLYSYKGNIKVCQNKEQLNRIYNNFFNKELRTRSFYVYSLNTVYTSAENFQLEILGHEIAHAVISHYFVVLPSVKIQEVLATYVAYQLRRSGQ